MKKYKKLISIVVLVAIFTGIIPVQVKAAKDIDPNLVTEQNAAQHKKPAKIVKEVEEKRSKNSKQFLMDDNSYEAVIYKYPVHYNDNGKWKDIDNSLVESVDEKILKEEIENEQQSEAIDVSNIENKAQAAALNDPSVSEKQLKSKGNIFNIKSNDFDIKFSKNSNAQKLVSLQKDKYEISWGLKNSKNTKVQINTNENQKVISEMQKEVNDSVDKDKGLSERSKKEKDEAKGIKLENEKRKLLDKLVSSLTYPEVYKNIDLEYGVISNEIKENIVLKKPVDNPQFTFSLKLKGLTPKVEKNNTIIFYDEKDSNKQVFMIKPPVMIDNNKQHSEKIKLSLEQTKKGYDLTLKPDNEWLNSKDTVYPVKIDPNLRTSLDVSAIHDTFVASGLPNENKYQSDVLGVGKGTASGTTRTYIKFDLPKLVAGDMIRSASLNLFLYTPNTTSRQINIHGANSDWASNTITWNNAPGFNSKVLDYQIINSNTNTSNWYEWNVTSLVKTWYNTGGNYGIVLKNADESVGYNEFLASDCNGTYAVGRPQIIMNYINNSGLESYWTYHSASAGRAGSIYTNDYNGNVIVMHDDEATNGSRMPISIKHVFNSNDKDTSIGYGPGWKLNLNQRILGPYTDSVYSYKYYIYIDEDMTKHYFEDVNSSGTYKDTAGLERTFTINADGGFTLTDKKNNKLVFVPGGYLNKIIDSNGNTAIIGYNGTTLKTVTDGSGKTITLNYNEYGYLLNITDPSNRITKFGYDGIKLKTIIYPDSKVTTYNYDAGNNFIDAINYDGLKLHMDYYPVSPYRAKKVTESNGTIVGKELNISYGYNTTAFTDGSGRKDVYQFNDDGQTLSIKENDGSAQYYKYDFSQGKNKLTLESKFQKVTTNYLKNHNIERNDVNWCGDLWTGSTGSTNISNEQSYFGKQSLKVYKSNTTARQFFTQQLTLSPGNTYTLSGYVKASGISSSGKGAAIFVNYLKDSTNYDTVDSTYVTDTGGGWQRVEVTFTIPATAANGTVYARAGIVEGSGTAYFDCLQLETCSIANRYNLAENGNFIFSDSWNKNSECDQYDQMVYHDNRQTFRIYGNANKSKNISQTINVSGNSGDVFSLGGWAKGDSVPLYSNKNRFFALDIGIHKTDGTWQWGVVPFNEDSSEWQYVSDRIVANGAYDYVVLYGIYYGNANAAYFSDVQLNKEEFGQSYQYDSKGNVISTANLAQENSKFEYDANNDLKTMVDPKGNNFKYEYDGKHNITKATSAGNVVYSFSYDSYGNPLKSIVGSGTDFIQSTSGYTEKGDYGKSITDSFGNSTINNWDEGKGLVNSTIDPSGSVTKYLYDSNDRITSVSKDLGVNYAEVFNLNNKTTGDNGTLPVVNSVGYENGYASIYESASNKLMYNLGVNKNSGSIALWFNTKLAGSGNRHIFATEGLDKNIFTLYIDNNNKINVGIRDTNGVCQSKVTSTEAISNGTDNFVALSWELKDNKLNCTLQVNSNIEAKIAIDNFKDFSGGKTSIGCSGLGVSQLNGYVKKFGYSSVKNDDFVKAIKDNGSYTQTPSIAITNSYAYENDRIKTITHNGFSYNFDYDSLGYNTGVKVGTETLITNDYDRKTGVLKSSRYGNDQVVARDYDAISGLLSVIKYNGVERFKYQYDSSGNLAYAQDLTQTDSSNPSKKFFLRYVYDAANRLVKIFDQDGNSSTYGYDKNNNKNNITEKINNLTYATSYDFDKDNKPTTVTYTRGADTSNIASSYDAIGRMKDKTVSLGTATKTEIFKTTYNYLDGVNGSKSTRLGSITNKASTLSYTYDIKGNIKTISDGTNTVEYFYNQLNELVRENNKFINETIKYTYDAGGNITQKIKYSYTTDAEPTGGTAINYQYGDSNWKDKLTSYNNKAITYDKIGNTTDYDGWKYTWEMGRQLGTAKGNGYDISYKYNDGGIRTQKTVNGVATKYHLVGDKVTFEENGTDKIYYTYDASNDLVSMNLNGVEYYYIRNAQNDISGLFDKNGTQVVSYVYDSWGKVISISGSLKDSVGVKNPYRYRGYRYDSETGLYYLQSRYYNPEFCRMLNADSLGGEVGKLLTHNVFSYCLNNPVNMEDPTGNIAWWIIGAGVGAVVGGIAGAVYSYKTTGSVDWRYVAGGAVAGALVGAGVGYLAEAAYGAIVGTATSIAVQRMENARRLGQEGEKAAKIVKNTQRIPSITKTAKYRIPDALDKSNKVLTEIKNVKSQGLTNQLKDFSLWADEKGYDFILKTRSDTKISGPLQEYIDSGKIIHLFIGD